MVIDAHGHVQRKLLAVSDDLTGATACAADIGRAGRAVSVRPWTVRPDHEARAVVLDSATRLESASVAAARVTGLIESWNVPGERAYYHRIDSALRGQVAAELDAVCSALGRPLVVAPAAPAFGAVTRGAMQRLGDRELPISRHVPPPLVEMAIAEVRGDALRPALAEAVRHGRSVVCDAETEHDLALVGAALRTLEATPVGSYGLGRAWACEDDSAARTRRGALAVVGSLEPAALAQVTAARVAGMHIAVLGSDLAPARSTLQRGDDVILASADPRAVPVASDPAVTSHMVAAIAELLGETEPCGLVLIGGQLASEFIRSAGVKRLDIICEPWSATPVVRLRGGRLDGLTAAVKSGARGSPDWLISSLRIVASIGCEARS